MGTRMNTSKRGRNETTLIRPCTERNIIFDSDVCTFYRIFAATHTLKRQLPRHQLVYRKIRRHFYMGYTYMYDTRAGGRNIYVNKWVGGVFSEKICCVRSMQNSISPHTIWILFPPCNIYSFIRLFQMRNKLFSYYISVIARRS